MAAARDAVKKEALRKAGVRYLEFCATNTCTIYRGYYDTDTYCFGPRAKNALFLRARLNQVAKPSALNQAQTFPDHKQIVGIDPETRKVFSVKITGK